MPGWKHEIRRHLAALSLDPTREAEIVEELAQYVEDRYDELLVSGVTAEEAARSALAEFGESELLASEIRRVEREVKREPVVLGTRPRGSDNLIADLWQDVRYASRMLLKKPGFALIAIITLSAGIGVNTASFTVFDAFVLKPLPLKDPDSITSIEGRTREGKQSRLFSYLDYLDYRDRNTVFAGLVAFNKFSSPFGEASADVDESPLLPANIGFGQIVSENYFSVLGAEMALGRGFAPEECSTPGTHPVMVLSYICWERRFNSDPQIIGKTIKLAGLPFTIIGVAERGFIGTVPDSPQFWIPLMMRDQVVGEWNIRRWLTDRDADSFTLAGRLKPGVMREQAQAEMNVIAQQLARQDPDPHGKSSVTVGRGATFVEIDGSLMMLVVPLLTAVGLILLIACANVANLLLARAASRRREIAVRLALGASRWRVIRQLLTESVLLSALGGAAGWLLTIWTLSALYPVVLSRLPIPAALVEQFTLNLDPDYRIFGFALLVSMVAGLAAGLAPALQASQPDLTSALKDDGPAFGPLSGSRLRNALVVTQIAVSLTLLIAAGLLVRNLQKVQTIDTGLVTRNVFSLQTGLRTVQKEPDRESELSRQLAARLRAMPGVKTVGQAHRAPLTGGQLTVPVTVGGSAQVADHPLQAGAAFVSSDYFRTLGLRINRGRSFTEHEAKENAPVVLISESTARRFWPAIGDPSEALGKQIGVGLPATRRDITGNSMPNFPQREVIGITNDTRQIWVWQRDEMFLYLPLQAFSNASETRTGEYLLVSTESDPRPMIKAARDEAASVDPDLFVLPGRVEDSLAYQMAPFKAVALLSGILGVLALLLASVGLYGVMSFVVSRRVKEIGIRVALGAQSRDVILLFLRQAAKLIAFGVAFGLFGGAAISGLLARVLVDISQFDPLAFCTVAVLLAVVALLACWVPCRRATKVDPLEALRSE